MTHDLHSGLCHQILASIAVGDSRCSQLGSARDLICEACEGFNGPSPEVVTAGELFLRLQSSSTQCTMFSVVVTCQVCGRLLPA
jgi:hypothetical protein